MFTPLRARKDLAVRTPLLCSKVASAVFFSPSLLLFSLFAHCLPPFLFFFSPFLSLSCTHARLANVGVWEMTHLLHTSSSPGHIWAARKSIFLRLCSGEREVMQRHYGELFSTFSFFSLHYVFFFSFPLFVERGPLISVLQHHKHKCAFHLLHGCIMLFRDFESLGGFFCAMNQAKTYAQTWVYFLSHV